LKGGFASGTNAWSVFGQLEHQVTSGILEWKRPTAEGLAGGLLQSTGTSLVAGQPLTVNFSLGNSSSVRKRVTALLHDLDFSDLSACTFWLEPGQVLSDFSMRSFTTKAWLNATLSFYAASVGAEQWILLDNVSLQQTTAVPLGTECVEPSDGYESGLASVSPHPAAEVRLNTPSSRRSPVVTGQGGELGRVESIELSDVIPILHQQTVDLRGTKAAVLRFRSTLSGFQAYGLIEASSDGSSWRDIGRVFPSSEGDEIEISLDDFADEIIQLRFAFHTSVDDQAMVQRHWLLREIRVIGWKD
jgi:hypothetical protein